MSEISDWKSMAYDIEGVLHDCRSFDDGVNSLDAVCVRTLEKVKGKLLAFDAEIVKMSKSSPTREDKS